MSAAAALVLAMTFSAERSVQAAAGGRVEVLAGAVPDDPFRPSRAQMALSLVPVVGLSARRQRYELVALYRPRVFFRLPNRLDMKRPLLLHQGSIQHRYLWSDRTTMQNRLQISAGEVDYALSSLVFDPQQPTVVDDQVTPVFRAQGSSSLGYALDRRTSTGATLLGAYNAPLYRADATGFRTSARANLEPFVAWRLNERDELTLAVSGGVSWFSTGLREQRLWGAAPAESGAGTYANVASELRLAHALSRQTTAMVGAGVAYLQVVQGSELLGAEEGEAQMTPTGEAQLSSRVWQERGKSLSTATFAQYRWFFDPILGRPVRRLGGGVMAELDLPPDWMVRGSVSFFTTVGDDDFEPPEFMAQRRFDQTMMRIDFPVSYEISRYVGLEFGVRSNLRGPALADGITFSRVELWAYGALRFVFDPRDAEAGWSQ